MAPRASEQAVRDLIRRIDPEIPVVAVRPVTEVVSESVEGRRFQTILASLGIFGVIAYSVEQRRHELGIRMALGAEVSDLRRLVLWQGMTPVAVGLASGLGSRFLPDA
jgi:putative ABC transport system permease protein